MEQERVETKEEENHSGQRKNEDMNDQSKRKLNDFNKKRGNKRRKVDAIPIAQPPMKVVLQGRSYDYSSLQAHIRGVMHNNFGPLPSEAQALVLELLEKGHPEYKKKSGVGIDYVKVAFSPQFPDTKCCIAVRIDGSEEDFSCYKCIDRLYGREKGGRQNRGGSSGRGRGGQGGGRQVRQGEGENKDE